MPLTRLFPLRAALLALAALAIAACSPAPASARAEYRALWVDIFHPGFRNRTEIDQMITLARAGGYNAILVQCRKAADAFYNSSVEPKNAALDPSFDPLGYCLQRAHDTRGGQRRLEVHAWLVTYRCRLGGDDTWRNPRSVFSQHPDWLGKREDGASQGSGEGSDRYYLDPGHPQVSDHILRVARDLLSRYADLDGIHFDYIRYPEGNGGPSPWGYNPVAVARFNELMGRTGRPAKDDPAWCEWRRRQVFDLVRKVYAHVHAWRPNCKVSIAGIPWGTPTKGWERTDAYGSIFQDWKLMAEEGFVDCIFLMNYKTQSNASEAQAYRDWAQVLSDLGRRTGRFMVNATDGEGHKKNSIADILEQLAYSQSLSGLAGVCHYCYAECHRQASSADPAFYQAMRAKAFRDDAPVPEATWLTRPSQGLIKGIASRGGKGIDSFTVSLDGQRTTHTDGSGFYAFGRVAPGRHSVALVDAAGKTYAQQSVDVSAGRVAEAPLAAR